MTANRDDYARNLAAAVGELSTAFGLVDDPAPVASQVLELAGPPLRLFCEHARWPSALTTSGVPFELSLKLDPVAGPSVRCVVDTSDHRHDVGGNWGAYLRDAALVAGGAEHDADAAIWRLCQRHLSGVPAGFASRMMLGLGYGDRGRRRGTLYFRARWLTPDRLLARLPATASRLVPACGDGLGAVEVVGYDFVAGALVRTKVYCWDPVRQDGELADLAAARPELVSAAEVAGACPPEARPAPAAQALFRQVAGDGDGDRHRLFFFCSAWGWDDAAGTAGLLGVLQARLGLDLSPLRVLYQTLAARDLQLALGMLSVAGPLGAPSVTFYLWPTGPPFAPAARRRPSASTRATTLAARIADMARGGTEHLFAARSGDGSWSDYALDDAVVPDGPTAPVRPDEASTAPADGFTTAFVAATLLGDGPSPDAARLVGTGEWLRGRYRPGQGWGWDDRCDTDAETTALALAALARLPVPPLPGASAALLRWQLASGAFRRSTADPDGGSAEVTAAALSALLLLVDGTAQAVGAAVAYLAEQQDATGGWSSTWWSDPMVATARAGRALRAARLSEGHPGCRAVAAPAVVGALSSLMGRAVPGEPFALGTWLGGWLGAGGPVWHPCLARVVAALEAQQQPDGRWLASPSRRRAQGGTTGSGPYADGRCLITTATVVAGLNSVRVAAGTDG